MTSPAAPSRTLIIDSRGPAGPDRARSRSEALQLMTATEYDTIVLHTVTGGRDDYDLVVYLAGTWPSFLRHINIRTITPGYPSYQWNHDTASFHVLPAPRQRLREFPHRSQPTSALAAASRRSNVPPAGAGNPSLRQ